ncbi:hypothetical protein GIB67_002051 [Kingdonia uniflora]|uniref:Uncharacterized protein n=1 Tax=Kingdonia uniflora TaxID=39325 RepID=A0A7J7KWB2_9MAGN|nr:hypothetical protein GIB67_002051 [Kingdonia uniflora]
MFSSRVVLSESEAQRVRRFCLGLTKRIQDKIILFSLQSLSEIVEMARRVETKLKPSGYPSFIAPATVTPTPTSTAPAVGGKPAGIVRTVICYKCGVTGHMRHDTQHYLIKFQPWMSRAYDPCTERYSKLYFNQPEVQKALHANITRISYPWDTCSDTVGNYWTDSPRTMLPIYQELIAAGLKIWVFRSLF